MAPLAGEVMAFLRVESAWNHTDRSAPNYYDRDRDLIRDVAYPLHVEAARAVAGETATTYRMINSATDAISPPAIKERQVAVLRALGFDAQLSLIGEDQVDGRLFKTLTHGLDASLAGLFDLAIPDLQPRLGEPDALAGTSVVYEGVEKSYRFTHSSTAPYVAGAVTSRFFED